MRLCILAFASFSGLVLGQAGSFDVEGSVRRQLTGGIMFGFDAKHTNVGDAAAVAVEKVTLETGLNNTLIGQILGILHAAFGDPAYLPNVADREPKATLVLLDRLNSATMDAALKARIAQERRYVQGQFAKASAKDSPDCPVANYSPVGNTTTSEGMHLTQVYLAFTDPERMRDMIPIRRMGDGVTDYLNMLVGDCALNAADTQKILNIIRSAFSRRREISTAPEHQPVKILGLLDRLGSSTADPAVKASVAETRSYLFAPQNGQ